MEFELENEIKEQPEPKDAFEGYWDKNAKVLSLFFGHGEKICVTHNNINCRGFSREECEGDTPVRVKKIILEAL